MQILVIDDDPRVVALVERYLGRHEIAVISAGTGKKGFALARENAFDAIILDIRMPDWDGFETLTHLREAGIVAPILFLTGSKDTDSVVRALDGGGDDFLQKPFELRELVARIRALVRRSQSMGESEFRRGKLRIDPVLHRAWWDDEALELTRIELRLLHALAVSPDATVTRESLLTAGWGERGSIEKDSLTVHMSNLRGRLQSVGAADHLITVRGVGYKLEL